MIYIPPPPPLPFSAILTQQTTTTDPDVWTDPTTFRPERWLEQPDAPLFTYGLGYRMCAGSLLANRELYLIFLRTLNSFEILPQPVTFSSSSEKSSNNVVLDPHGHPVPWAKDVDIHPVSGSADPTSLVTMSRHFKVVFKPRDAEGLARAIERNVRVKGSGD